MRIVVFDSGVGGEYVAARLRERLPAAEVIAVNDARHVPYGNRTPDELFDLTNAILRPIIKAGCEIVVIACNTVTTNVIARLRAVYPHVHFVGIEPMLKPAARATRSGVVAVCATPGTLRSRRYQQLKSQWLGRCTVIEPDCRTWAPLIESGKASSIDVALLLRSLRAQRADVLVLACTHYHWLKRRIIERAGTHMRVLEPTDATVKRVVSIVAADGGS